LGGLITWYIPKELAQLRESVKSDTASQVGSLNEKVAALTAQINNFNSLIPELLKQRLSLTKRGLSDNLQSIGKLAEIARLKGVRSDPREIGQIGERVISIAESNPTVSNVAWKAALDVLNYHSYVSSSQVPDVPDAKPFPGESGRWQISVPVTNPGQSRQVSLAVSGGLVAADHAAVVQRLGDRRNEGQKFGPRLLTIAVEPGVEIHLDGFLFRNAIIRNARIVYGGGPVVIERVYFASCTFDFPKDDLGIRLGKTLLTSMPANFQGKRT
jgi:hypothetical protein